MLLAGLGLLLSTACAPARVDMATPAPQPAVVTPALPTAPGLSGPAPGGFPAPLPEPPPPIGQLTPPVAEPPTVTIAGGARIALLLPLSGRDAPVGRALQEAAELAVFDFGDDEFVLNAYDTEARGAAAAAERALRDGARLILGPLFARAVPEVAAVARAQGVNVITFSNDRTVAGSGVFIMGLPPSEAIARVVGHARSQGVTRFAALLPSDPLGNRIGSALERSASGGGAEVARIEYYDPGQADLTPAVRRVAGAVGSRTQAQPGTQALVLAESGQRLRTLAPLLPFNDIDPVTVRLIGTPAWEDLSLGTEPALIGAWFAAPDPAGRADFERKYREAYGRSPLRIATLAYDATGLAAVLARMGGTPDFSAATLANASGFAGVDGIFRFHADGVIERGLAVLKLDRRAVEVISPAPATFEAATN